MKKIYTPKSGNVNKLVATVKSVTYKRIERMYISNEVMPTISYQPSLKELIDNGLTRMESLEVLDRLDIHGKNRLHTYSSQLLHINETPVAIRKEISSNIIKGLKK